MQETDTKLLASVLPHLPENIQSQMLSVEEFRGDITVVLKKEGLRDVVEFLKTDPNCRFDVMIRVAKIHTEPRG